MIALNACRHASIFRYPDVVRYFQFPLESCQQSALYDRNTNLPSDKKEHPMTQCIYTSQNC